MTRRDKLISMKMNDLVSVAKNLGVKINPKARKWDAVEKILAAEEMNKQNEKELKKKEAENAIEEPKRLRDLREQRNQAETDYLKTATETVNNIEKTELVPMPGAEKLAELKGGYIDPTLLAKLTKKEQKLVTSLFKNEKGYHVTYEFNGKSDFFDSKSMYKIGLKLRYTYKGE